MRNNHKTKWDILASDIETVIEEAEIIADWVNRR